MPRTLEVAAVLFGLVAFTSTSHAFTVVQGGSADAASQLRVADPDDLMQNMQDEQSSGTVSLPGGAGELHFDSGANAPGGANSPFLPAQPGAVIPSQR